MMPKIVKVVPLVGMQPAECFQVGDIFVHQSLDVYHAVLAAARQEDLGLKDVEFVRAVQVEIVFSYGEHVVDG